MQIFAMSIVPLSQSIFHILNVRLLHYYLPNQTVPSHSFVNWNAFFAMIDVICIGLLCLTIIETILMMKHLRAFWILFSIPTGLVLMCILSIVSNSYSVVASLLLQKFLKLRNSAGEKELVDQIGKG